MKKVYKDHRQLSDFTGGSAVDDKFSVVAQVIASMCKGEPSLEQQLASAKAEIAEYRTMIESIVHDAKGYESRGGNLPLWAKDADKLLAKHKGSK